MIVFEGALKKDALKYFCKKFIKLYRVAFLFAGIIMLPFIVMLSEFFDSIWVIFAFVFTFVVTIFGMVPIMYKIKGKDEAPKKVYIKGDIICSVFENTTVFKQLEDIKEVHDYGAFYDVIYTKVFPNFVCQKDLLKKGTLEEFEALFEGKIIDKTGEK